MMNSGFHKSSFLTVIVVVYQFLNLQVAICIFILPNTVSISCTTHKYLNKYEFRTCKYKLSVLMM